MESVASPAEQAADLLQKLVIDSSSETVANPSDKAARLSNSVDVATKPNLKSKDPSYVDVNSGSFPNVYPSTAYSYAFPGYGHGSEWNNHSPYYSDEAVDSSRAVPGQPGSPNLGNRLCSGLAKSGLKELGGSPIYHQGYGYVPYGTVGSEFHPYLYHGPYYAPHSPSQVGSPHGMGNDGSLRSNLEHIPSNSNTYYGHGGTYSPLSGVDASEFSNPRFNRETNAGSTSALTPAHSRHPAPNLMDSHRISTSAGLSDVAGLLNQVYPNAALYAQYRNSFSSNTKPFGYLQTPFSHKPSEAFSKYKARYANEGTDGLNELNRGPRVKVNIPSSEKDEAFPVVRGNEGYNREDFEVDYDDAKFFVIKSYSEDDVHKSIKYGMWASTATGNKKLDAAYREAKERPDGCPVFLFFSVNTSGQFVGVAEMVGPVDFDRTVEYWQQDKWQGCFPVKWHIIKDVQNSSLRHIKLANNEDKPVTNSRDTQEVEFEEGIQILKIFKDDEGTSSVLDDFKFYEDRERKMQEKRAKQEKSQKQVKSSLWNL